MAKIGPQYCYYPNESKTHLVVKPQKEQKAKKVFQSTEVQITCASRSYLGGALGTKLYEEEFMAGKIVQWTKEIPKLAELHDHNPMLLMLRSPMD